GRPAPLLTTRRELQSWRQASGEINAHSASLEAAVAEAARFGRDSSGRFYGTLDWLEQQQSGASVPRPDDMSHLARADSWVAWEPLAGESAAETLTVFRPALLSGVSWVVAFLFLLAAWSVQRSRLRGRYALLLLWLAANGLAYLWSPESWRGLLWWPLLAGVLIAALWFIRVALSSRPRSGSSAPATSTTTLLVL